MVANAAMLSKPDVVAYVANNASRYGLDPVAVLSVADHEGLNTTPGSAWVLPGEGGAFNFGPPSWQSAGAGKAIVQQQGANAASWAWTPAGLDYWLNAVANSGAAGLTGMQAVVQIVGGYGWGFERPANPTADITNAQHVWDKYAAQVAEAQGQAPGNTIVPTPDQPGNLTIPPVSIPGQTQPGPLPIPSNPQANPQANPQVTTGANFSLHLFDTPFGPFNLTLPWDFSGILLFLAALLALIIGALMWDKSRGVMVNVAETGAAVA